MYKIKDEKHAEDELGQDQFKLELDLCFTSLKFFLHQID